MFINIIHVPPIKEGKDAEFCEWFVWSNPEYANIKLTAANWLDG